MASLQSTVLSLFFPLIRKSWESAGAFHRSLGKAESRLPPKSFLRRYSLDERLIGGFACYAMRPRTGGGSKQLLFLHGGAFVHEMSVFHWRFLGRLVDALGCSVSIPAYPLATVADHNDCLSLVTAVYLDILSGTASSDIALLGDSAGGGMALALAQSLRDGGVEQPGDIVLLSPWLDLSLGNPEVIAAEKVDALLAIPGLLEAARMYAGGTDLRDPRLSPIYGSLEGLGRLAVFVGAEEMFVGDARKLRAQLDQRGIAVDYREYAAMFHDWCLFPLPEAHRAIGEIIGILRRR